MSGARARMVALGAACAALAACARAPAPSAGDVRGGIARPVAPKAAAPGLYAPATAPSPGALDYLSAYVGRAPVDSDLWNSRPLHDRLVAMLGADYDRFTGAMPRVALGAEAGVYYVAGRTRTGIAAVVMDPRADSVYAVEQDPKGRREYLERSHKPALPAAVRSLLASAPLG